MENNKADIKEVKNPEVSQEQDASVQNPVQEEEKKAVQPRQETTTPPLKHSQFSGSSEFVEKVVSINRVTKVTKGGKKLSFTALVVVGDGKGRVGYYLGKANEVATAIRKALGSAKKKMIMVPMKGSTITHQINGECGGALVMLKPASEGTGVIAAGPVRAVCDAAGIHNILTKCHRSNNPVNVIKATINGFENLKPLHEVSEQE